MPLQFFFKQRDCVFALQEHEGHFRSNENVIILAYSILLTRKL